MNVGIFVFDEVEVLDFAGPFEVFSVASRLYQRLGHERPFEVFLIAEQDQPVVARNNFKVLPHYTVNNHPVLDVCMVAGGVVDAEMNKPQILQWIREQKGVLASVCTGAFILAKAGLLQGKKATTHWEDIPDFKQQFPETEVIENTLWVDEGDILSSGGISAGIELAFHLVERFLGKEHAKKTAVQMEYVAQTL